MGWATDGGEDIGGQLADRDFLIDNNLPEEYWAIQDKWRLSRCRGLSLLKTTRVFLANVTPNEMVIIAKWMLENGYGNPNFRTKAGHIIEAVEAGKMNRLPQNQQRCLLGFIRPDITKLP